eukprot:13542066-Ditylum_brightwellii.AAC.1
MSSKVDEIIQCYCLVTFDETDAIFDTGGTKMLAFNAADFIRGICGLVGYRCSMKLSCRVQIPPTVKISHVHPRNSSKNHLTSLLQQDTRTVSQKGIYVRYPNVSGTTYAYVSNLHLWHIA